MNKCFKQLLLCVVLMLVASQSAAQVQYQVKENETPWDIARKQLEHHGIAKPTNLQIIKAQEAISWANGFGHCDELRKYVKPVFGSVYPKLVIPNDLSKGFDELVDAQPLQTFYYNGPTRPYVLNPNDTLYALAKRFLVEQGVVAPGPSQVMKALTAIAGASGFHTPNDCKNAKFRFNLIQRRPVIFVPTYLAEYVLGKPIPKTEPIDETLDPDEELCIRLRLEFPDLLEEKYQIEKQTEQTPYVPAMGTD